ncbi:MAG: ABC transporter substrate-binding protein [Solirubrobacterales bacterium]|nr:ABC transporter substrate-binding protein [Solirubrobacterales bacterium]
MTNVAEEVTRLERGIRRWPLRRLAAAAGLALCGLWIAACGGKSSSSASGASSASSSTTSSSAAATPSNAIRIGILSDCAGDFGAWYNADIGGAQAYFIAHNGAKPNGPVPSNGITGGTIAGHPIKIVGYGCADDTAAKALSEVRRLVEADKAQIVIGPLSGDEGIAVANYSKTQPGLTFINGTSGAQDTTLKVRSPNFYRFNGDGAQWSAGVGDVAYRKLGWRHAVVIMDDYAFGWTSAAGFIADFCADGGTVTRIYPPLGTTDYSSYISQIPQKFDGLFSAVGGTGTLDFLKQYTQSRGAFKKNTLAGNIFLGDPAVLAAVHAADVGALVGQPTNEDTSSANAAAYISALKQAYPAPTTSLPKPGTLAGLASSVFTVNYYMAAWALDKALTAVHGDLSNGQAALHAALAKTTLPDAPYGPVTLDQNRQAIVDNYIADVTTTGGTPGIHTIYTVPGVTQAFGGTFTPTTPSPGRGQPVCQKRALPWQGKEQSISVH